MDPGNFEILKGKLNCFRNTFDWENLSLLVERMWDDYQTTQRSSTPDGADI